MDTLYLLGFTLGPTEIVVVGIVALLLFGNRLPNLMRSIGQGFREFRDGVRGIEHDLEEASS